MQSEMEFPRTARREMRFVSRQRAGVRAVVDMEGNPVGGGGGRGARLLPAGADVMLLVPSPPIYMDGAPVGFEHGRLIAKSLCGGVYHSAIYRILEGEEGGVEQGAAVWQHTGLRAALKVSSRRQTGHMSECPVKEADALAYCSLPQAHPNVVQPLCIGENASDIILVLPYFDQGDLCAYICNPANRLTEREGLALYAQVASAVHFLHDEKHVANLDLSAENIGLCSGPEIVLDPENDTLSVVPPRNNERDDADVDADDGEGDADADADADEDDARDSTEASTLRAVVFDFGRATRVPGPPESAPQSSAAAAAAAANSNHGSNRNNDSDGAREPDRRPCLMQPIDIRAKKFYTPFEGYTMLLPRAQQVPSLACPQDAEYASVFDPYAVDAWAVSVIFFLLIVHGPPWAQAIRRDGRFQFAWKGKAAVLMTADARHKRLSISVESAQHFALCAKVHWYQRPTVAEAMEAILEHPAMPDMCKAKMRAALRPAVVVPPEPESEPLQEPEPEHEQKLEESSAPSSPSSIATPALDHAPDDAPRAESSSTLFSGDSNINNQNNNAYGHFGNSNGSNSGVSVDVVAVRTDSPLPDGEVEVRDSIQEIRPVQNTGPTTSEVSATRVRAEMAQAAAMADETGSEEAYYTSSVCSTSSTPSSTRASSPAANERTDCNNPVSDALTTTTTTTTTTTPTTPTTTTTTTVTSTETEQGAAPVDMSATMTDSDAFFRQEEYECLVHRLDAAIDQWKEGTEVLFKDSSTLLLASRTGVSPTARTNRSGFFIVENTCSSNNNSRGSGVSSAGSTNTCLFSARALREHYQESLHVFDVAEDISVKATAIANDFASAVTTVAVEHSHTHGADHSNSTPPTGPPTSPIHAPTTASPASSFQSAASSPAPAPARVAADSQHTTPVEMITSWRDTRTGHQVRASFHCNPSSAAPAHVRASMQMTSAPMTPAATVAPRTPMSGCTTTTGTSSAAPATAGNVMPVTPPQITAAEFTTINCAPCGKCASCLAVLAVQQASTLRESVQTMRKLTLDAMGALPPVEDKPMHSGSDAKEATQYAPLKRSDAVISVATQAATSGRESMEKLHAWLQALLDREQAR